MREQSDAYAFARESLEAYAVFQWRNFVCEPHHRLLIHHLEAVEAGRLDRLIVSMPPRHGKSEITSKVFPSWYLGRHPDRYVIGGTYNQHFANAWGRKVRDFMRTQAHLETFRDCRIRPDAASVKEIGLASASFSNLLYSFVANPQVVNSKFLGVFDLTHPSYVLAVLAAGVQFLQTRQMLKPPAGAITQPPAEVADKPAAKDEGMAAMMNKQMTYMMPILTAVIGFSLPGGLSLYWLTMSLLTVVQQQWLMKKSVVPTLPAA
jgi:hypothetical protein